MPGRGGNASGRGRKRNSRSRRGANNLGGERKRTRTEATENAESSTESVERVNLSLDEEEDTTLQGNIPRHPLVEEVFDISKILNDSAQGDIAHGAQGEGQSFTLTFGEDADPPNIIRCANDDLAAHVPNQLKQKIWGHTYINISLLLKGNAELSDIFSGGLLHVGDDGKIEAKPRQTKDKIASIEQWSDAFLIFSSIYLTKFPTKLQEILKYMATIRDAASKFPNFAWRLYDEQFRIRQALQVSNWGKINSDLWLRIMPSTASHSATLQTPSTNPVGTCRYFNKGSCSFTRCRYRHACDLCDSSQHGMVRCQAGKNSDRFNYNFRGFRGNRFFRGSRGFQGRGRASRPWLNN